MEAPAAIPGPCHLCLCPCLCQRVPDLSHDERDGSGFSLILFSFSKECYWRTHHRSKHAGRTHGVLAPGRAEARPSTFRGRYFHTNPHSLHQLARHGGGGQAKLTVFAMHRPGSQSRTQGGQTQNRTPRPQQRWARSTQPPGTPPSPATLT